MDVLGIVQKEGQLQWALIHQQGKRIVFQQLGKTTTLPEKIDVSTKIVTGLEKGQVLRRDIALPLSSKRLIRQALPFQLEPLLPFALDQAIIFPQYYPREGGTDVIVWATNQELIQSHLSQWNGFNIEPDVISCQTLAFSRWLRFFFPEKPRIAGIFDQIAVVMEHEKVICAMHAIDPGRLQVFLQQKYPLFEYVEFPYCNYGQWSKEELRDFAIPIGLALEPLQKQPCQLRSTHLVSHRQKKQRKQQLHQILIGGALLMTLTLLSFQTVCFFREKKLKNQISFSGSLPQRLASFKQMIVQKSRQFSPIPQAPEVQEVLAWISQLNTGVNIQRIEYELITPSQTSLKLEFQAESVGAVEQFMQQLQQPPTFVESPQEVKWTYHHPTYTTRFILQNRTL